jgi:quinol monooxygenase YgiN
MIVSHGKFVIRTEHLNQAKEAITEMINETRKEPGCISYDYFISMSEPNVIMLFQEWESIDAVNDHFATPHMERFLRMLPDFLESEVVTHRYALSNEHEAQALTGSFEEAGEASEFELEFELEEEPVTLH